MWISKDWAFSTSLQPLVWGMHFHMIKCISVVYFSYQWVKTHAMIWTQVQYSKAETNSSIRQQNYYKKLWIKHVEGYSWTVAQIWVKPAICLTCKPRNWERRIWEDWKLNKWKAWLIAGASRRDHFHTKIIWEKKIVKDTEKNRFEWRKLLKSTYKAENPIWSVGKFFSGLKFTD
jgi:hypothetical protein